MEAVAPKTLKSMDDVLDVDRVSRETATKLLARHHTSGVI